MIPAQSFDAAVCAIEAVSRAERADTTVDPRCYSFVLQHGRRTGRAILLFHGFTNCPRQFTELANLFFARGFNVYVPRMPRHGLSDKLTPELAHLTVDELVTCATNSARIAGGLGTRLSVMGLSLGGTLAAWLAQTRDVDCVAAIAPFFSVAHVAGSIEPVLAGALEVAPNLELWWDPRAKEETGPAHGYPRFATHALARCLQLGENVRRLAHASPPLAEQIILVLNEKDPAIDNAAAQAVCALWRDHGAAADNFIFENLDARHDIIEPTTYPDAATLVYPELLRLMSADG